MTVRELTISIYQDVVKNTNAFMLDVDEGFLKLYKHDWDKNVFIMAIFHESTPEKKSFYTGFMRTTVINQLELDSYYLTKAIEYYYQNKNTKHSNDFIAGKIAKELGY